MQSTFPFLIEIILTEIKQVGKANHKNYVLRKIFCYEILYLKLYDMSGQRHNPLYTYKTTTDPDYQAIRQKDWSKFRKFMQNIFLST